MLWKNFFDSFKNDELRVLYEHLSIRIFASGLIAVFIPVFMYIHGFSLSQIMGFYAFSSLIALTFAIPAMQISSLWGYKHSIIFSVPLNLLFVFLLFTIPTYGWSIIPIAFVRGLTISFFFIGYHVDLSKFSNSEKAGSQIATARIVSSIASSIAPFMGGLIAVNFGFIGLLIVVFLLMITSLTPLLYSKDILDTQKLDLNKLVNWKDDITYFFHGIHQGAVLVVWPLYIFVVIGSIAKLGFFSTLTLIASLLFTYSIGNFVNTMRKTVLLYSGTFSSFLWFLRIFVSQFYQIFLIQLLGGANGSALEVSFDAINYDKGRKSFEVFVAREIMMNFGKFVYFGLLFLIPSFEVAFLIAMFTPLAYFIDQI